jgi:hypothetical protein
MGLYGDADLVMTRDVPYTRTLVYKINDVPIDWTLYTVTAQVRDREEALWFDFTPYLAVNPGDHTQLVLSVPRDQVQNILHDTKWDLVAVLKSDTTQSFRTPQPAGRVLVQRGVTDVP